MELRVSTLPFPDSGSTFFLISEGTSAQEFFNNEVYPVLKRWSCYDGDSFKDLQILKAQDTSTRVAVWFKQNAEVKGYFNTMGIHVEQGSGWRSNLYVALTNGNEQSKALLEIFDKNTSCQPPLLSKVKI